MKTHNPLKNNWDNWNWDGRPLSFFSKRLKISCLPRNEKVNMKYDISKKTAPKVLKQENMNENSAIFELLTNYWLIECALNQSCLLVQGVLCFLFSDILVRISFVFQIIFLSLHKISCTRQFESKLSLRSFALSLQNIQHLKTQ